MRAAVISEQGLRPAMEDAHFLDPDFGRRSWVYGGVYDGHNGVLAANYAAQNIHKTFLDNYSSGLEPGEAFVHSYETVSGALRFQESGAAAADFFIRNGNVFTANAGDCRAVVVSHNAIIQLTTDHRLDNAEERTRVEATGAVIGYPYVFIGQRGLMTTRAIGDHHFRAVGVISTPSLNKHRMSADDLFLICASDGLWDFMPNEEVAALARKVAGPEDLVACLRKEVLVNRLGTDNLTIIAVSLQ